MKFKDLFKKAPALDAAGLRRYMAEHPASEYTLLDVRQPSEYDQGHIPGAVLIPLGELPGRLEELDSSRPTITYCAVGGRSRAAAQLLQGQGFDLVYNLTGGIKAWDGVAADGPPEWGLDLVGGGRGPADLLASAWGLEEGLALVYRRMAEGLGQGPAASLLRELAGIEDRHKARLAVLWAQLPPEETGGRRLETVEPPASLEGGWSVAEFLARHGRGPADEEAALNLALTVEGQALDLYLRLARLEMPEPSRAVLLQIAAEEQAHLAALGRRLDQTLAGRAGE